MSAEHLARLVRGMTVRLNDVGDGVVVDTTNPIRGTATTHVSAGSLAAELLEVLQWQDRP